MDQQAGGSSNDDNDGSAEWKHMMLPAKAREGIFDIIDSFNILYRFQRYVR